MIQEGLFKRIFSIAISLLILIVIPAYADEEEDRDQNIKLSLDAPEKGGVNGTGTFHTSIPIALPPSKGGFAPSLGLKYSSQTNGGIAGHGWSYGIDCISRHSVTYSSPTGFDQHTYHLGTPNYDATDSFFLNGKRLIQCMNNRGGSCINGNDGTYRTEIDSFKKIARDEHEYYEWIVFSPDGSRKEYGGDYASWKNSDGEPYRWCVYNEYDVAGNGIYYDYENPGVDSPRLVDINYSPSINISFTYEPRPDPHRSYSFGVEEIRDKRLTFITVNKSGAQFQRYKLEYAVDPTWLGGGRDNYRSLLSEVNICGTSTDCTGGEIQRYRFEYGRPYQDYWDPGDPQPFEFNPGDKSFRYADINGDGFLDVLCRNSGTNDACDYIKYGNGNGQFVDDSSPLIKRLADVSNLPYFVSVGQGDSFDDGVLSAPITGSRYPDFIVSRRNNSGIVTKVVYSGVEVNNTNPTQVIYQENPNFNASNAPVFATNQPVDLGVRLVDLNGDGLLDIVKGLDNQVSDRVWAISERKAWLNTGSSFLALGYNYDVPFNFVSLVDGGEDGIVTQNWGAFLTDINSDGLTDIIKIFEHDPDEEPEIRVFMNNALSPLQGSIWVRDAIYENSLFAYWSSVAPDTPPACFSLYNLQTIDEGCEFADINGDGLSDLVQSIDFTGSNGMPYEARNVLLNDGTGWLDPSFATSFAPPAPLRKGYRRAMMRTLDIKRTPDIVKNDFVVAPFVRYRSASFPNRDRLTHIVNPLGGHQFISYEYVNDLSKNPNLSRIKIAVKQTCTADGRYYTGYPHSYGDACSETTDILTTYAYHGGEAKGVNGGFSGFRYNRQVIGGDQVTETWQNTQWCTSGLTDFSLQSSIRGNLDECAHYGEDFSYNYAFPQNTIGICSDAQILSSVRNLYSNACPDPLDLAYEGKPIFKPVLSSISTAYEPTAPAQRLSTQQIIEFNADDAARGRPSRSCTFADSSTLRFSCSYGVSESGISATYAQIENHPQVGDWIFNRKCESNTLGRNLIAFQTEKLFYKDNNSCSLTDSSMSNAYYLPERIEINDNGVFKPKEEIEYSSDGNVVMHRTYGFHEGGYEKHRTIRKSYYSDPTLLKCESYLEAQGDPCASGLRIASYQYDVLGRPQTVINEDSGISTTYTYDSQHRERHRVSNVEDVWTNYVNLGNPDSQYVQQTALFNPASTHKLSTRSYFDGLGRNTRTDNFSNFPQEESLKSHTYYDNFGRAYRKLEPYYTIAGISSSYVTETTFDRFGRPEQEFHNGVLKSSFSHKITNNYRDEFIHTENWPQNQLSYMRFDSLERKTWAGEAMVAGATDCGGDTPNSSTCASVRFDYDDRGFQNRITLPSTAGSGEPVMFIDHDDLGRTTSISDPNMSNCSNPQDCPWTYAYDFEGRLLLQTNAGGAINRIVYDNMGRKIWRVNCSNAGETETVGRYIYDPDHISRLTEEYHVNPQVTPGLGLETLCDSINISEQAFEDLLGNIPHNDLTSNAIAKRIYFYYPNGNLQKKTVINQIPGNEPTTASEEYAYLYYGSAGPMKQLRVTAGDGTDDTFDIAYNSLGQEFSRKTSGGLGVIRTIRDQYGRPAIKELGPNPIRVEYTYHPSGHTKHRLQTIRYDLGQKGIYRFSDYDYDNVGNITGYQTSYSGAGQLEGYSFNQTYSYDVQNQLKNYYYSTTPGAPGRSAQGTYEYDALGNRTSAEETQKGKTPSEKDKEAGPVILPSFKKPTEVK